MALDRRPRVVFLSPAGGRGGAERSLLDLLASFPRTLAAPAVLMAGPGPLAGDLEGMGIEVLRLDFPPSVARLSRTSGLLRKVAALPGVAGYLARLVPRLARLRPTLLWSNGIKFHYLACLAGPLIGARPVLHFRDLGPFPGLAGLARWAGAAGVANSPSTASRCGLDPPRVQILPSTVGAIALAQRAPARDEARRALGIPPDAFLVLGMGARVEAKGLPVLFDAFALLVGLRPGARLAWVGGEEYQTEGSRGLGDQITARARALGLLERLYLPGEVEDVAPWLAAADVFALPSRAEGFGRAWLEAAAVGLPVLASDRGGAVDLFSRGEAELLPPEDPAAWCRALARLADDPGERAARGRAARAVARRFDTSTMADRIVPLVERLLRGEP